MERFIQFEIGEYYHIYSRGVEKRDIYLDDSDYFRFVLLLYLCNSTENIHLSKIFRDLKKQKEFLTKNDLLKLFDLPQKNKLVSICAYCLMPNHFHLILKEICKNGISLFMMKLLTSFSMHFNKKYERSGPLFVKPFRAKYIKDENYFKHLFCYVHLNPVKIIDSTWKEKGIKNFEKAKNFLNQYNYSSYLDYLGSNRMEQKILSFKDMPDYPIDIKDFKNLIENLVKGSP